MRLRELVKAKRDNRYAELSGVDELDKTPATDKEHSNASFYHCTLTKNIPRIRKDGILPMQTSNWVRAGDKQRYGEGEIFAFETLHDAARWAAKWDWEISKSIGSGKVSVVSFKADPAAWTQDLSDPLGQAGTRGKWIKKHGRIPPEDIIEIIPMTNDAIRSNLNELKHSSEKKRLSYMQEAWKYIKGLDQKTTPQIGDPIVVTYPNEFQGKTGDIYDFSPSREFVIVDLYNHGKHSMHLSDIEYNNYADQDQDEDEDDNDGSYPSERFHLADRERDRREFAMAKRERERQASVASRRPKNKTEIIKQFAKEKNIPIQDLPLDGSTDFKGFPTIDEGHQSKNSSKKKK